MKNGLILETNWLLFYRDGKIMYGFFMTPKDTIRPAPIENEAEETESLKGNRSGNSFITTQINYNGKT